MGLLRYLARVLPGFFDRFLRVAEFISTVWQATDGGLKKLSSDYKDRRPGIVVRPQINPTYPTPRQVSTPPPYRAIASGSYNSASGRDYDEDDDDDGVSDVDRTFFYSVNHRRPYSDYELRKWLKEVQD